VIIKVIATQEGEKSMSGQDLITINANNDLSIATLIDTAMNFAEAASSKNTRRTYSVGWRSYSNWCQDHGTDPMGQAEKEGLVALYAADMASKGKKISSLSTYLAAICSGYRDRGVSINLKSTALEKTLTGIRKSLVKRPNRKAPILTEDLREMIALIPVEQGGRPRLIGLRDRALLLLGFAGAFRRSELVALSVEDLSTQRDGLVVLVRKSKTDQEGAGKEKVVPYGSNSMTCPVRAVKDWLDAAGITEGPIFRSIDRHGNISEAPLSGYAVSKIIKRNQYIMGKDSSKYGGHSLRAGFVTEGVTRNVPRDLLMAQTGHTSNAIDGYIRRKKSFTDTAAAMVGL
jgi:integrase